MTIEVRIKHNQPGYDRRVRVTLLDRARDPSLLEPGTKTVEVAGKTYVPLTPTHVVEPGEELPAYVYGGRCVLIEEE